MNLTGIWLGQTIGIPKSAIHVWIIAQHDNELFIYTHWLGFEQSKGFYWATINPTYSRIATLQNVNRHINIINRDTFTIKDWIVIEAEETFDSIDNVDKNEIEANVRYDVYFQRRDKGIISTLVNLYISLFRNSPTMLRQLNR